MAKKRTNNRRTKAAAKKPAAEPLNKVPKPPATLGKYGTAYWKRIAPKLVDLKVLTDLHLEPLESLCHWWDIYQTQYATIRKHPDLMFIESESGYRQKGPEVQVMDAAFKNLTTLWARFGLTPDGERKLNKPSRPTAQRSGPTHDPVAEFAAAKYEDD